MPIELLSKSKEVLDYKKSLKDTYLSGKIVKTKNGTLGRTYNHINTINGKIAVYSNKKEPGILCDPETITILGYIK